MNILITSGGTTEAIDDVRKITNMSTGKLGSLVAQEFAAHVEVDKVIYVCAQGAMVPSASCVDIIRVTSVADLQNTLTNVMTNEKIDAVVHAMAVSDYTPSSLSTAEDMAGAIAKGLMEKSPLQTFDMNSLADTILELIVKSDGGMKSHGKVSSNFDHLILSMEKTPKIISFIKQLQPSTVLVGFKLLDGVPEQELLRVAYELLEKNHCDFVLANDLQKIQKSSHVGLLLKPDQSYVSLNTKEEIAKAIAENVILKIKSGEHHV